MNTKYEQGSRITAARLDDIPDGGMLRITVEKRPILLCRQQEWVFAVGAICPHRGAPLEAGRLSGALLACPWHGARFDVRTGSRLCAPESPDLPVYPVVVNEGQVELILPSHRET